MPALTCARNGSFASALILALILGLCAAPSARAAWGTDLVLDLGFAGTSGATSAAFLPTGTSDIYVLWRYSSNGPQTSVDRVSADGALLFTHYIDNWSYRADAADGLGGLVDAFQVSTSDIAFRRINDSGTSEPVAFPYQYWVAQTSALEYYPAAASDPAGGAYLGWAHLEDGRYFVQRVTATGAVALGWPALGRRITTAPYTAAGPAMLPDGSGGIYVMFPTDRERVWRVLADTTLAPGWPAAGLALESSAANYNGQADPSELALVPSGANRTFAAWTEGDGGNTNRRVVAQSFSGAGVLEGSELILTPFAAGISRLSATEDGQGGLLVTWVQSGVVELAHVLADRAIGAAAFAAVAPGARGNAVTPTRNGGFLVFGDDASGVWGTWYLANGSLDPSEPVNPRLVQPRDPTYPETFPVGALSDGDGGAFLVFDEGGLPSYHELEMRHVFRSGVLDAGTPPRPTRMALSLAPNPARSELMLELALVTAGPASLELLDVSGRSILARTIAGGPGSRRERLVLPDGIAPGIYLARLTQGADAQVRRFAVLN